MAKVRAHVPVSVQSRILDLDDVDAVRMLRLVLEKRHGLPDEEAARELARHLREAAGHSLVLEFPSPSTHTETGTSRLALPANSAPVSAGDLAREALLYLLTEQPELEPVLWAAAEAAQGPIGALTRPGHLDLGVQVLLALREEVTLEHGTDGSWYFRVHRKALNDGTLAGVLAKLVAAVSGPRLP